jgi:putative aldouronate transport system substrate-binding protein
MTLVVLMVITLFTGCSPKPEAAAPATPAETTAPDASKIGTKDAPVKVTYLCKDVVPTEENVQKLVTAIEEGMAAEGNYIDLEVLEAPAGKYAEVVPIAFRTGQVSPDLIYFQGGDLPIAQEGMLEDLTQYINGSTNVKALMQSHNVEAVKNYPYLLWLAPARVQIPVMRTDWFNSLESSKALLENPTPDNYYAMFKEMKDKKLCEYPITTDGTILKLDSVFNHAFGVTGTIVKVDGKYVYSKATQFEKDKLAFYAKLYKDGLLDKEYVTKPHCYFNNMPCGCIMDWEYYMHLINGTAFCGGSEPDEVIAASFGTGLNSSATGYEGGFNIGRYNIGDGVLTVNTFDIAGNIGKNPAADMLLCNIISNEIK